MAVVRIGSEAFNARTAPAGAALPVTVDYILARRSSYAGRLSVEMPTAGTRSDVSGGYSGACTLSVGIGAWNHDAEGFPSNSADGAFGIIPCYDMIVGGRISGSSPKTIALLSVGIGTNTTVTGRISQGVASDAATGWRQVASLNGRQFYTSSVAQTDAGFRYIADGRALDALGGIRSVSLVVNGSGITAGTRDARGIGIFAGQLYGLAGPGDAGWDAVFAIRQTPGGALPTSAASVTFVKLPGMTSVRNPWTFVFQDASAVWVSVEGSRNKGVVQLWRRSSRPNHDREQSGGSFAREATVIFSYTQPVYSLAGRWEKGSFVLYGTDSARLYIFDSSWLEQGASMASVLSTAPAHSVYRGVMFPGRPQPSPSETSTPSPSHGASSTGTPTATRSRARKRHNRWW